MTEISDELLMAYIDGQLDKPQATVVAGMLRGNEDLARRVRCLQENQARFLETFGALVREGAMPGAKPGSGGPGKRRSARGEDHLGDPSAFVTAGVAALLVVFGASLGFTTAYYSGMTPAVATEDMRMPPANWSEDIAELHGYFIPETLTSARDSQANPELVKFQLGKLSSHLTALPDFSQSGLRFVRAQMLTYRGNRLMQLVYSGRTDPLVALYITPGDSQSPVTPGRFGDVATVSWSQSGLRFLIAGEMTQEALRALAAIAQSQLGRG